MRPSVPRSIFRAKTTLEKHFGSEIIPRELDQPPIPLSVSPTSSDLSRQLRGAGYLIAIATIFVQLTEVVLRLWPYRFSSAAWRLTLVSTITSTVLTLLLMTFIIIAIAIFAGDRPVTLVFGGFSVIAAITFFVLSGMFILDAVQLRNQVQIAVARQYDITSVWTLSRALIGLAGFTMLSVAGLRSGITMGRQAARQTHKGAGTLIVGSPAGATPASAARVSGESAGVKGG